MILLFLIAEICHNVLKIYGYKNIHLICWISVTVTNKDYHAGLQMDKTVNLFCCILVRTAVNDAFYPKVKFKF